MAAQVPDVRVVDEPRKGLVVARETGRRAATGDILVYLDADCRAPLMWLERVERRFERDPALLALSAPYRFYDWDWWGRLLIRAYDFTLAPATQLLVKYVLRHRHDLLRRQLRRAARGARAHRRLRHVDRVPRRGHQPRPPAVRGRQGGARAATASCITSARRYVAMGKGAVFRLYVRNFTSELLHHRPKDTTHHVGCERI